MKKDDNINKFETASGVEVKPFYGPEDLKTFDYEKNLGDPGKEPYTRGTYPSCQL